MITFKQLLEWRQRECDKARAEGKEFFLMLPDEWYENVSWFCQNGHVSKRYLRTEGSDRCLACGKAVVIGPPTLTEWDFQLLCRGIAGGKEGAEATSGETGTPAQGSQGPVQGQVREP